MSKKSFFFWNIFLVLVCLNLGFFAGHKIRQRHPQMKILRTEQNKINETLELINNNYVDTVDIKSLTESAVGKIISELDPHSSYIPAADVEAVNEDLDVSFGGIGITFNMFSDTIVVVSINSGGPAEKAGLMPFDRILTVDDSVVAGKNISQNKMLRMLRGPKNSKVMLGIQRSNVENIINYELIRGDIPNHSIDISTKVDDHIGYIKVTKFARSTYSEFLTAIAKLKQDGVTGFVIDLRGNPGGYMETAAYMSNEFLPKDKMIVYTQGKAYRRSDTRSNGKGTCQDAPIVVLIDEFSGSASEIFSGAIQDNDRGLIVGRRSFGKGLVQTKLDLSDNSELLLTIARYYTPSGRCIQKDYELGKSDEYSMDLYNRDAHGEYFSVDSIKLNESLAYKTVGGRTVYGGGGIMPDIFIPFDTTGYTSYYLNIRNAALYQFSLDYSDKNQEKLKTFDDHKTLHEYLKQQPLIDELADFAASKGIRKRPNLMEISRKLIETQLYAYILRNFFDNEGFYAVLLQNDATLHKAIEVIQKDIWKPEVYNQFKELETDEAKLSTSGSISNSRNTYPSVIASLRKATH